MNLTDNPIHLGLGATAVILPQFTGDMAWYEHYAATYASDGVDARLVSLHHFTESWTSWEMHPAGAEVVLCTAGSITLVQELADGSEQRITLGVGDYAINPPGVWHTADIEGPEGGTALFITAGMGTQHRPRV